MRLILPVIIALTCDFKPITVLRGIFVMGYRKKYETFKPNITLSTSQSITICPNLRIAPYFSYDNYSYL